MNTKTKLFVSVELRHIQRDEHALCKYAMVHKDTGHKDTGHFTIELRLPVKGEYALQIYASSKKRDRMHNVCNYIVTCEQPSRHLPYPHFSDGRLGPGLFSADFMVRTGNQPSNTLRMGKQFKITMEHSGSSKFYCELTHYSIKPETLCNAVNLTSSTDTIDMDFNLPAFGEYGLNLYACKLSDPRRLYHVFTYFIKYKLATASTDGKTGNSIDPTYIFEESRSVSLSFDGNLDKVFMELLPKHVNNTKSATECLIQSKQERNTFTCNCKMKNDGEYDLNVFRSHGASSIRRIQLYRIFLYTGMVKPPNNKNKHNFIFYGIWFISSRQPKRIYCILSFRTICQMTLKRDISKNGCSNVGMQYFYVKNIKCIF